MNPTDMNRFAVNPVNIDISRSLFNRNHSVKLSFDLGEVIPFYIDEVMPGDTFSVDTTKVVRVQPLVTPIFDNIVLDTYYFFIPYRLVWSHWINFMGENTDSPWTPSVEYLVPTIVPPSTGWNVGTIADYLGVPPLVPYNPDSGMPSYQVNALPFRAYALVCDQWFRSTALQNPVHVTVDETTLTGSNGTDQVTDIEKGGKPFIACKLPDYFTMGLPQPQSGPDVTFGLASLAPVYSIANKHNFVATDSTTISHSGMDSFTIGSMHVMNASNGFFEDESQRLTLTSSASGNVQGVPASTSPSVYTIPDNLFADLYDASSVSVNQLRTAFAVQRYYETLARGGRRYIEQIKAFYDVESPDARLQRSEYLGGNRMPINVTQVEQTSSTDSVSPQGNVTGMSLTGDDHSDFSKSFTEHGMLLGVLVARYQHTYQQGLEKIFSRSTVFDYYNPKFASIGEMPIYKKEICLSNNGATNRQVFAYQEAWADYRYKPNRVCGQMRSVYSQPLE